MRGNELGCDARRGDEAMLDSSLGAATPQRAHSAAACGCGRALARERTQRLCRCVGDPALRVEAGRGVCGVVGLGKGLPLPASSALHPSSSGLNAIRRMIENRP